MIHQAPETEKRMKVRHNDNNVIYRFYDRNKALRVYNDTIQNIASGTCEIESHNHLMYLLGKGIQLKDIRMYRATVYNEFVKKRISHQYLCLRIKGKWYNESRSNGLYKRIPQDAWEKVNKIKKLEQLKLRLNNGYVTIVAPTKCSKKKRRR